MRIGDLEIGDWQEESETNYTRREINHCLSNGTKSYNGYIIISNRYSPRQKVKFAIVVFGLSSSDFIFKLFADCQYHLYENKDDAKSNVDQMLDRAQKIQVLI